MSAMTEFSVSAAHTACLDFGTLDESLDSKELDNNELDNNEL